MTERVHHSTLQHTFNRMWADGGVAVLIHWTMFNRSCGQSAFLCCNRVVYKELDPDGCEARRRRGACSVGWRLTGKEELGAINRETCDYMLSVQMPHEYCPECSFVECDRGISITDRQHGRDLSWHAYDYLL